MPVQEPETVKVKLEYESAKIAKEVKKKELNIYKQKNYSQNKSRISNFE